MVLTYIVQSCMLVVQLLVTAAMLHGIIRINWTPGDCVSQGQSNCQLRYWLHIGGAIEASFCTHNIRGRTLHSKKLPICTKPTAWIYFLKSKNKLILYSWVLEMLMVCCSQVNFFLSLPGYILTEFCGLLIRANTRNKNFKLSYWEIMSFSVGTTKGNHGKPQVSRYHLTDSCLGRHTRLLLPKCTAFQKSLLKRTKL